MLDLSTPLVQLRVVCGTCTGIAIITTIVRLFVRLWKSRLWWDDTLAIFSMCALIAQMVAVFICPDRRNGVVRYYLISNMFYATIWSARLSILFAVIRIARSLHPIRYFSFIAAFFLLTWVVLTAQLYWECETETTWKNTKIPQCRLSRAVAICQLVTDVISDSSLLFVTIRLFVVLRERGLRYRLIIIFGTCVITTIVSFVHAAYLIEVKGTPILTAAVVESAVSLIVCNVPVMATAILKLRTQDAPPSSPDDLPSICLPTDGSKPTATTLASNDHLSKSRFGFSTVSRLGVMRWMRSGN